MHQTPVMLNLIMLGELGEIKLPLGTAEQDASNREDGCQWVGEAVNLAYGLEELEEPQVLARVGPEHGRMVNKGSGNMDQKPPTSSYDLLLRLKLDRVSGCLQEQEVEIRVRVLRPSSMDKRERERGDNK